MRTFLQCSMRHLPIALYWHWFISQGGHSFHVPEDIELFLHKQNDSFPKEHIHIMFQKIVNYFYMSTMIHFSRRICIQYSRRHWTIFSGRIYTDRDFLSLREVIDLFPQEVIELFDGEYIDFLQDTILYFSRRWWYISPGDDGIFLQEMTVYFSRRA